MDVTEDIFYVIRTLVVAHNYMNYINAKQRQNKRKKERKKILYPDFCKANL